MGKPYQHKALFIFLHSVFHYISSTNAVNDQGVEYTPSTRMAHTYSSLISYFRWKNDMNFFSYRTISQSHQVPIDYIEPKSTWSTNMDTPSGRPSTITPADNPQYPHIITLYEDSICSESPIHITTDTQHLPPPPTKGPTTEPSD